MHATYNPDSGVPDSMLNGAFVVGSVSIYLSNKPNVVGPVRKIARVAIVTYNVVRPTSPVNAPLAIDVIGLLWRYLHEQ